MVLKHAKIGFQFDWAANVGNVITKTTSIIQHYTESGCLDSVIHSCLRHTTTDLIEQKMYSTIAAANGDIGIETPNSGMTSFSCAKDTRAVAMLFQSSLR